MTRFLTLVALSALVSVPFAYGKGSPDAIVVFDGGLNSPIQITDASSLRAFDPWNARFMDLKQALPGNAPCFRRSVQVGFYRKLKAKSSDATELQPFYITRYCSTGSEGFVYLPGPGEPTYPQNAEAIVRGDADGKWYPATAAWNQLLSDALAARDAQANPDMIMVSGGELQHPVQITDPELLEALSPWTGKFVDWEQPAASGPCNWEYEITYFKDGVGLKTRYDTDRFRMIYGLRYCFGNGDHPGYVHLAGRTDKFWAENVHSVWDGDQAGEWHPSTLEWKAFIRREVDLQRQQAASSSSPQP